MVNVSIRVRIIFSGWVVSCYAHVFCATLGCNCHTAHCNIVITYCFYSMLQTDMQLSPYLFGKRTTVFSFCSRIEISPFVVLGAMHSCNVVYFVRFYSTVFYPLMVTGCPHCIV